MARPPQRLVILITLVLCGAIRAWATIDASLQMQLGNPSNASADPGNHEHYLIQRSVEAIDYNDNLGEPNWASWDLTASDVGTAGRTASFITDTTLPPGFYEVMTGDYTNSGYDRGHMCPSADRTDNDADNALVFYMSNVLPQTPDNNQGVWESFEAYCRSLASAGYELLITCGGSAYTGALIPSGKAAIPGYTWKIAVVVPPGGGSAISRIGATTRVIAIKIPNIAGIRSTPWAQYVTSTSQIQTDTGFTFFTALPVTVASVLRARVDGAPTPSILSFAPASSGAGATVVLTGTGFTSASSVMFNGASANFIVNSDTQITAAVPADATSGPISVIAPGGLATSSSNFEVTAMPAITGFTPSIGTAGTSVVLTGRGFTASSNVAFNGTSTSFSVDSDTQITTMVPAGATSGAISVTVPGWTVSSSSNFTVASVSQSGVLYISQFYGGGGNSGALYKNDFIEIYNAGTTAVDLSTYAVQYCSATGSTWQETPLSGLILPGHYYLVQEAQGSGGTVSLPTPQAVGTISMAAASGKVALTKTQTLLGGSNPIANSAVLDFVGYGSANAFEGTAAVATLSNTTSAVRAHGGGGNTNNNATDFSVGAPTPENGTAMDSWRTRTFSVSELSIVSISGNLANPSGDGMTNLFKYAFNLDPHKQDGPKAMTFTAQPGADSVSYTMTHRKNHYAADLTFSYELSYDSITWTSVGVSTPVTTPLDSDTDTVSVSASSAAPKLFLRVKVTQ